MVAKKRGKKKPSNADAGGEIAAQELLEEGDQGEREAGAVVTRGQKAFAEPTAAQAVSANSGNNGQRERFVQFLRMEPPRLGIQDLDPKREQDAGVAASSSLCPGKKKKKKPKDSQDECNGAFEKAGDERIPVSPAAYTPDMPNPTPYADVRILGFNARERARLRVGQRLMHLTGVAEMADPGSKEAEYTLTKQLASLVVHGGNAPDILSAREQVARLLSIARDLYDEVQYLQNNPEEAKAIEGYDFDQASELREELFRLCKELEGRAGEPEPMKSLAAERMRQKLETRLLPTLNKDIPRWAERLRFRHAEVLKWIKPDKLLEDQASVEDKDEDPEEQAKAEAAAAKAAAELLEAKKQTQVNTVPKPKGKELEMLRAMGWNPDDVDPDGIDDDGEERAKSTIRLIEGRSAD